MKRLEIYRLEYYLPFLNGSDKIYDYFNEKYLPEGEFTCILAQYRAM